MELMKIPAKEIQLGDVLGEGIEVHTKINKIPYEAGDIRIYWGKLMDMSNRIIYQPNEIVTVLRG